MHPKVGAKVSDCKYSEYFVRINTFAQKNFKCASGRFRAARLPPRHRTQGCRSEQELGAGAKRLRVRQLGWRGGGNDSARAGDCSRAVRAKNVGLFFTAVAVAAHELVDAAGGVDELLFAGEEGVRRAGDFEFYQRISNAINFDGFFCSDSRACDEDFFI